jgi:uncharacterized protein (TIGR02284 family)
LASASATAQQNSPGVHWRSEIERCYFHMGGADRDSDISTVRFRRKEPSTTPSVIQAKIACAGRSIRRMAFFRLTPMENDLDNNILDHLKRLHTSEIDARNGYEEALEDAEGKGLTPLFRDMIALHQGNVDELAGELNRLGEKPDDSGSFLSTVHRTIINLRSLFNGLDDSVLPGLIDGEKRNVKKYDEALEAASASTIAGALSAQRDKIQEKIALMEARKTVVETAS